MKFNLAAAALLLAASSTVASAQTWQTVTGTSGAGTAFWDNKSNDGEPYATASCNVGAILLSTTVPSCNGQSPSGFVALGVSPTPNQFLGGTSGSATAFFFGAGQWELALVGSITGANPLRTWRAVEVGTNSVLGSNITSATRITTAAGFYLQVDAIGAGNRNSNQLYGDLATQFAVFTKNGIPTGLNGQIGWNPIGQSYFVGIEDNACMVTTGCRDEKLVGGFAGPSDRDYQDYIVRVTAVPEPESVALVGAGLAALLVAARRRKTA